MQLRPLTLKDKPLFDVYARRMDISLSNYAFAPLYIWGAHFDFYWGLLDDYFCVFAKQGDDYFMPIGPVGEPPWSRTGTTSQSRCACSYRHIIREAYQFMLETNRNPQIARIENVPQEMLPFLLGQHLEGCCKGRGHSYPPETAVVKEAEYLYETQALAQLKGNRYKSKRHAYNAFVAQYPNVNLRPYSRADLGECLALYDTWQESRAAKCSDAIYRAMLEDSRCAHRIGLAHADALGLIGRVVQINGHLRGWTFGYPLSADTFCILFEVTDLEIKGLAQFIYREFARELANAYRWLNAMGDSGLANLKRVKRSYHPARLIPSCNLTSPVARGPVLPVARGPVPRERSRRKSDSVAKGNDTLPVARGPVPRERSQRKPDAEPKRNDTPPVAREPVFSVARGPVPRERSRRKPDSVAKRNNTPPVARGPVPREGSQRKPDSVSKENGTK